MSNIASRVVECFHVLLKETYFLGGYQITVDSKKVKTPAGKPLVVPNKTLAMAVSVEWNSQDETIKPANMHLVQSIFF